MALFEKKQKRALEVMEERNRQYLESVSEEQRSLDDQRQEEVYPEGTFEKGDLPAIVISALIVFLPVFIVLGIVILLAFRMLLSA